jgi:uncharacterized protein (TIGR02186 family)
MLKKTVLVLTLFFVLAAWHTGVAGAVEPIEIKVDPDRVDMDLSYNGCSVSISGGIPSDAEVLVRIVGPANDLKLKRKGRALGLLWMNMGSLEFHHAPSMFLLFPSVALSVSAKEHPPQWRGLGLGFEALKRQIDVTGSETDKEAVLDEFIKLKENAGLYGEIDEAVRYGNTTGGMKSFTCVAALPSGLPQGVYTIEAFAMKDNVVLARGTERIKASQTGIVAGMTSLAFNHGTLYGIIAVLVAIVAGLLTGLIFKGGSAH